MPDGRAMPVQAPVDRPEAGSLTFRLLGQGIAYSASPAMMTAAFGALGLPHRYVLADIPPDGVRQVVEALRVPGSGGANVTVPHKAAVAVLMDEVSDDAQAVDAVNVVVRDGDRLIGHNTDLPATIDAVNRLRPDGIDRAVVLGAGGAGRAVGLALARVGAARVTVLRRSDGSIARLADALADADLLVNATPVGTRSDESPVPADLLRPGLAVLDLVYRPSPTRLVRDARAVGARAEAGAGVLLGQAWRSLQLWLERPAPVETMRAALDAELGGSSDA
jgi:shikimate dehydrogenase